MAQPGGQSLFKRLRKLFSTDVIIRNVGGKQLKVIDTGRVQSSGNIEWNRRVDRYNRLYTPVPGYTSDGNGIQLVQRIEVFRDYEAMDADSIIASALDIYADECTTKNEYGDIVEINTGNDRVKEVLNNLFYDILNVDFNLWPWVRNLCKYGDFFLVLNIAEKYGIVNVEPVSPYEMIRLEGTDPNNPNKVVFKRDYSGYGGAGYVSRQEETYDNYEVIHFRMLNDTNFLPYGRSMIEPGRRVYKQLLMMEDAMLIHRIMRAPDKRIFKIDIGNIPPNEVDAYIERIANQMKKTPYVDPNTGEYNLKFNLMNMIEDFYLPVRGSESGTNIENLTGLQYDSIADIDYLKNRLLASLKIPRAYLGYEEDTAGKSTLASQDFRFARTIERIQRIVESELTKLAIIHLYAQGFTEDELVDFSINLSPASTVFEREKIELWTSKVTLAGDMMDKKLFSKRWIYENIFHMSDDDYLREIDGVIDDMKFVFRLAQIESEGNDPSKTGMSFGTPHDIASLYKGGGKGDVPTGYDEREIPEGGWPGAGRPESHTTYGKHKHPLGWDPMGSKYNKRVPNEGSLGEYRTKVAKSAVESLFGEGAKAKKKVISALYAASKKRDLLDESNLLDNTDS
jgi:hypothetical protein